MRGAVDQPVVERVEDGDKEKKRSRRRSNRRSKQNSSVSVNEIQGEALATGGNAKTFNYVTPSSYSLSKPYELDMPPSSEHGFVRASDVNFNSMPTMHVNGQADQAEVEGMQTQNIFPSDTGVRMFSNSCPESIACEVPFGSYINKDFLPHHQTEGYVRKKYFAPHWPMEDVNEALEKADVLKAVFRVNAHNRLEAYCKIDGVPTDVLINGFVSQNRAVSVELFSRG